MSTQFTETNALLLALEDVAADSGNHEPLDEYLIANFTRFELRELEYAADLLSERARAARLSQPQPDSEEQG